MDERGLARGFLTVLFAISCPLLADAASVTLAWDAPIDGITVGYIVSYGQAPKSYSQQVDVGSSSSYTVSGLTDGTTYYFMVRAYDTARDLSDPSVEVSAT